MNNNENLYEEYHINNPFSDFGENTFMGDRAISAYPSSNSALDFGCGNGYAVKKMRDLGKEWYGLEYSKAAKNLHLSDPYFFVGKTGQFRDRQFDLGYSTEVFEHIPVEIIDETIGDFCRVISSYMFLTISLRPSSNNNKYHCTLRSRAWWESKFTAHGFEVDTRIVNLNQRRTIKDTKEILKEWAHLGPDAEDFCHNPPYKLDGEREPWFFCFKRRGMPSHASPPPKVSWINRNLVPIARKILGGSS